MIYIVEDDNSIRELVVYTLENMGMEAKGFESPKLFWSALDSQKPELVLLDLMLPEEDGISILKKIRNDSKTKKVPVILLTAKDSEYEKVLGLDSGADDYITKPFGIMELMARIKAVLRRLEPIEEVSGNIIGDLELNEKSHQVKVKGDKVMLTLKEFEMLGLLIENKGRVISRDELLNKVWGYSFDGENRTVDVHIRTLRQKLGECGNYIETVRGKGYKIGSEIT